jgi:hypothetical protein
MNTTVQINTTPKTTSPRRSRFPGKESGSVSFNLTALGRQLLKEQAANAAVSNGDYVEMLIRERAGLPPLKLPATAKQTGPKGGAKSYFFGKNRGTTTAVCVTSMAHRMLDEQVAASRMSRGDYIEYLLREKAGVLNEEGQPLENESPKAPEAIEAEAPSFATTTEPTASVEPSPAQEPEKAEEESVAVFANPGQSVSSTWGN